MSEFAVASNSRSLFALVTEIAVLLAKMLRLVFLLNCIRLQVVRRMRVPAVTSNSWPSVAFITEVAKFLPTRSRARCVNRLDRGLSVGFDLLDLHLVKFVTDVC